MPRSSLMERHLKGATAPPVPLQQEVARAAAPARSTRSQTAATEVAVPPVAAISAPAPLPRLAIRHRPRVRRSAVQWQFHPPMAIGQH